MKSVLISIQPKWCELIASGKKTIEVRKTKPRLETPFKVYVYCTHSKNGNAYCKGNEILNGKVIGEFVCETIDNLVQYGIGVAVTDKDNNLKKANVIREKSCLTDTQICNYLDEKDGYAWHISNLVIYDKPRELGEFHKPIMPTGLRYENDTIARPPQSWCYVESEVQGE